MDISKIRNIRLIRRILITFSCQKKDLASGFKQPYIFFIYWSYGLIVTQHKNTLEFFFFFFIHLPKKFFESLVEWMPGAASWAKSIERSFLDYGHGSCWAESIETPERGRFFFIWTCIHTKYIRAGADIIKLVSDYLCPLLASWI